MKVIELRVTVEESTTPEQMQRMGEVFKDLLYDHYEEAYEADLIEVNPVVDVTWEEIQK